MTLTPLKSEKIIDSRLAQLSQYSVLLLITLIILKVILSYAGYSLSFGTIALIACLPILLASKRRFTVLRQLDWHTLIFFVGLFIFMKSVWLSGYFQSLLAELHLAVTHKATIFSIGILLSQLISNVPLVALYLPLLDHANTSQLLSLAVGSTLAGNLLILGAASNIIIIQNAEKRQANAFSFWGFFKIGFPLTICNSLVYYLFLP